MTIEQAALAGLALWFLAVLTHGLYRASREGRVKA